MLNDVKWFMSVEKREPEFNENEKKINITKSTITEFKDVVLRSK